MTIPTMADGRPIPNEELDTYHSQEQLRASMGAKAWASREARIQENKKLVAKFKAERLLADFEAGVLPMTSTRH